MTRDEIISRLTDCLDDPMSECRVEISRYFAEAIAAELAGPTMPKSIVNAFFGKEREAWEHGFKTGCRMMQERAPPPTEKDQG